MSALRKRRIADMSAFPLRVVPQRSTRAEQNRLAQERSRAKKAAKGLVMVQVQVTAAEAFLLETLRNAQAGPKETFHGRALITGAKFVFNSGNVRGGKKRIKGGAR